VSIEKTRGPEKVTTDHGDLRINTVPRYCKGCGICVKFCPKSVLEIRSFKVNVAHIENCIECMQCELRCPDFAIEVHGSGKKRSEE